MRTHKVFRSIGNPEEELNKYGSEGWRLVTCIGIAAITFEANKDSIGQLTNLLGIPKVPDNIIDLFKASGYTYIVEYIMERDE